MCDTDEKPITNLKSVCRMATNAPYIIPITAKAAKTGAQYTAPSGNRRMPMLRMPTAPSFIKTPACSMETADGAATWPVGDQP